MTRVWIDDNEGVLTVIRRAAAFVMAVLSLSLLTSVSPPAAQAQGVCPYVNYCIWVDVNFVWPQCWWEFDDGTYSNDWCTSSGNEWLQGNVKVCDLGVKS